MGSWLRGWGPIWLCTVNKSMNCTNYLQCYVIFLYIYIYIYKYNGEIKMYFYLAMVGFEPTPTTTAAPSNTETTVIPSRPLRSLKKELS